MSDEQKVKDLLATQEYMTLAVTLDDGTPWAVPVKTQLQWGTAFEWDSSLSTEHSKAIAQRPDIAIMVFDKTGATQLGFYAKAQAKLLKEFKPGFGRYQAIVSQAWVNDETFQKREIGLVDEQ